MPKGIIGKKIGMTQIFREDGTLVPVTVVEAGPCVVVQKKEKESDGYDAVQLGFGDIDERKLSKPELGHFKGSGVEPKKHLQEFRNQSEELDTGDEITVENFKAGELVNVSGTTKGKGFAGNIKRWNHKTGPKTHGSHFHRAPGSIGSVDGSRVFKGQKMPGRMGSDKVTIQNLEIADIDLDKNLLLIKGSLPGPKKSILTIESVSK
jgi:large subunit ribosomal protein L3